jgi:hypothetical protein
MGETTVAITRWAVEKKVRCTLPVGPTCEVCHAGLSRVVVMHRRMKISGQEVLGILHAAAGAVLMVHEWTNSVYVGFRLVMVFSPETNSFTRI